MKQLKDDFKQSAFWNFLELKVDELEKGNVKLKLPIKPAFHNITQSVHGGIYASILDTTMGFSARSLGFDEVVTLQMNVHFLNSVSKGTIFCAGRVIQQMRSTILLEADLFDEDGNKIAHSTGTFRVANVKPK